jgi:hypothetical protein
MGWLAAALVLFAGAFGCYRWLRCMADYQAMIASIEDTERRMQQATRDVQAMVERAGRDE